MTTPRQHTLTDGTTASDVDIDARAKQLAATDPELQEYGARNGDHAAYRVALSRVLRSQAPLTPIDRASLDADEKLDLMARELMERDPKIRELTARDGFTAGYRRALVRVDATLRGGDGR